MLKINKANLTKSKAIEFAEIMAAKNGLTLKVKKDSKFMHLSKYFVAAFSGISTEEFMVNYTTTIFKTIYPSESLFDNPWKAIKVITHECKHGRQFKEDYFMTTKYLFNKHERARFEAEALRGNIELEIRRYGKMVNPRASAERMGLYGITKTDVDVIDIRLQTEIDFMFQLYVAGKQCLSIEARQAIETMKFLKIIE